VREVVFDSLAEARLGLKEAGPPRRHRLILPMVLAAGLGVIALGSLDRSRSKTVAAADDPAAFVEDYLRTAVSQEHIETSDPEEIVRFLQREMGVLIRPLDREGLELARAENCLIEGRRGAMIVYKKDGAAISHYFVPRESARARAPSLSDAPRGPHGTELPGVTWATNEVEQALVGALRADQLLLLAGAG